MRVVVALAETGAGSTPAVFAEQLRDGGIEVIAVVDHTAPARAAGPRRRGTIDGMRQTLAHADVLVVSAGRGTVTADLVEACDGWGVRIVVVCRRASERRSAQALGLATVDTGTAPTDVVAAVPGPRATADPVGGRVIVVWGAAGAPGRTTLAIELACELARDGRRVALVDADAHAPSVALLLGLTDEGPGFAAACRQAARGRLTAAELTRIAVPLGDVAVLPGINRPGRWPELAADRVEQALSAMREWVDVVVVDIAAPLERDEEIVSDLDGPRRNAAGLAALGVADLVVAVVAADPVGVSRFVRAHPDLRAATGSAPVRVVVNKLRAGALGLDARGQVRRSLERFVGIDRVWFVPWDPRAVDAALLAARPLAFGSGRGAVPAAVRRLVGEGIVPPPVPAARRRS